MSETTRHECFQTTNYTKTIHTSHIIGPIKCYPPDWCVRDILAHCALCRRYWARRSFCAPAALIGWTASQGMFYIRQSCCECPWLQGEKMSVRYAQYIGLGLFANVLQDTKNTTHEMLQEWRLLLLLKIASACKQLQYWGHQTAVLSFS